VRSNSQSIFKTVHHVTLATKNRDLGCKSEMSYLMLHGINWRSRELHVGPMKPPEMLIWFKRWWMSVTAYVHPNAPQRSFNTDLNWLLVRWRRRYSHQFRLIESEIGIDKFGLGESHWLWEEKNDREMERKSRLRFVYYYRCSSLWVVPLNQNFYNLAANPNLLIWVWIKVQFRLAMLFWISATQWSQMSIHVTFVGEQK
jgi:hypothetical protein